MSSRHLSAADEPGFRVVAQAARPSGVFDRLDTGVVLVNPSGRIGFMNSAAEQCMLISRDRANGQRLLDIVEVPAELRDALEVLSGDTQGIRLHELKFPGGLFDCTLQIVDDGNVLMEFHNLEWEKMRLRLQQREMQTGMLELLSRNLGHEVRNPLGGIRGAAQMLAEELDDGELTALARLIMRESDRIDELIQRFGQPELDRGELDLYRLLDEAYELLAVEFRETVRIERDYDPSIPPIHGDAIAIRRIVLNLLRNAAQAGAAEVLVRTRVEYGTTLLQSGKGSLIRIDVTDNGTGVPESLRSLLFLPFMTGRRDGTGLGLSLSQQIASAHGGLLTYEPAEPGSRFTLYLPIGHGEDTLPPGEVH